MKVREFDFVVTIDGKHFNASAQKFKVHNYPQIRVDLEPSSKKSQVYVFYELDDKKIFWFELPDKREGAAKKIANALKKVLFD
jgi:hypothetical protein